MNRAKRLLAVLDGLIERVVSDKLNHAGYVWSIAFGLNDQPNEQSGDETVLAMQAFRAELDLLTSQLAGSGLDAVLYHTQFARLKNAASPAQVQNGWQGIVGNIITPDVRLALAWAAAVLPDDEAELSRSERDALAAEFDELIESVANAELPPTMSAFATKQLRSLRNALRMYPVRGISAVHEGLEQTFGAAQRVHASVRTEAAAKPEVRSLFSRINAGIARAMVVCGEVEKAHKGGSALLEMAKGVETLLETASKAS
jgi:hypothetical protein